MGSQRTNPGQADPELFASEQVITCRDDTVGLRAVIAIDDTTLGPGFGGTRWRWYPSPAAAVVEAQRLAAAMTLKHALANLPYGGAKSVIMATGDLPLQGAEREAVLARFGDFVARTAGSYVPGVDMGTTPQDMRLIESRGARAFCDEVDPGPYTARGVYAAMRAGVRHALGRDMDGVRVTVQGTGHVGASLARQAAADGAVVAVADIDAARADALAEELGSGSTVVDPAEAPFTDCDVFAPCAIARVLTVDNVGKVRARVVAGAANDTLDSPEAGAALRAAGVTVVPDFVANAGGVIQVHAGIAGWSDIQLSTALEEIGDRVTDILAEAEDRDLTPEDAARDRAARRLATAREDH
ncbi:Glu/Leu/Phe/Val dehydrogenase dimerization domain-containing protein [Ornithinicoccus hortensis]|uniref:Leucine dehydrogenase n=1 Tax=Ornithinicoccus hortensis TaxID=82346 RepID=A0A542YNN2_9MICO|nr:Glu/Leu/Phe/Val dehydrogenase dimerization domain-containing protein [Ornithinicoccus hortensis]TQL49708.1 leucine dehydrogenase [Ornithinicoccus hortensis]